jgi:hypothetical protein
MGTIQRFRIELFGIEKYDLFFTMIIGNVGETAFIIQINGVEWLQGDLENLIDVHNDNSDEGIMQSVLGY